MRETAPIQDSTLSEATTFAACVAAILELARGEVPEPRPGEDAAGWRMSRWLGGMGLGLVPVAAPAAFSWPGFWVGWVVPADRGPRRAVVMFGVPSGVAWDPSGVTDSAGWEIVGGFVIAATDVALARAPRAEIPISIGVVESIWVAPSVGAPGQTLDGVRALAGRGLEGDRHVTGAGTFPSNLPGSALTLIEAEVCESFSPPLTATVHRRNIVCRGIELNGLVGHEFLLGSVRCRGMRLCEPCNLLQRYASRPVLGRLIHRAGLRADILVDGVIRTGDTVRAVASPGR